MGGGLIQLVSKGAQDVYLTGNPQVTFFKVVYRRHTNFSTECIQQLLTEDIHNARTIDCHLKRDGDLIYRAYFEYTNNHPTYYPSNFGNYMIEKVDLLIGGQLIDSHLGHWMDINARLRYPQYSQNSMITNEMCGSKDDTNHLYNNYQKCSASSGVYSNSYKDKNEDIINEIEYSQVTIGKLSVPLQFFFCENPGLALPLIALQYNEVVLHFELRDLNHFMNQVKESERKKTPPVNVNISEENPLNKGHGEIWVEYVYLDTDERRRFAQVSHEYLIEQIQYREEILTEGNFAINLVFNNSVKELVFACDWNHLTDHGTIPGLGNYRTGVSIKMNGNNIFSPNRSLNYFTRNLIFDKHTGNPNTALSRDGHILYKNITKSNQIDIYQDIVDIYDIIGVYSFALKPEEHQPTGTFNFSMVSKAEMTIQNMCPPILHSNTHDTYEESRTFRVYAVTYNLLRIMSGMGKLAYI